MNERQEPTEYQPVALPPRRHRTDQRAVEQAAKGCNPTRRRAHRAVDARSATWPGIQQPDIWGPRRRSPGTAARSPSSQSPPIGISSSRPRATPTPHRSDIVAPGGVDIWQHQFSEELQLSGTAFSNRLTWVGGFWYFDETARDIQRSRMLAGPVRCARRGTAGVDCAGRYLNAPCPAATAPGGGIADANDRGIARLSRTGERLMENDSYALFVHGTLPALTSRWSVTLGGRQSHESKAFTYRRSIRCCRYLTTTRA